MICVKSNDKWGYLNSEGENVIPCIYEYVGPFNNGFAEVMQNQKLGVIDINGNLITEFKYDKVDYFENGLHLLGAPLRQSHL